MREKKNNLFFKVFFFKNEEIKNFLSLTRKNKKIF
jgi:hypothetical protein